jgi:hypothetical protein
MGRLAFGRRATLALPAVAALPARVPGATLAIGVGVPVTSMDPLSSTPPSIAPSLPTSLIV